MQININVPEFVATVTGAALGNGLVQTDKVPEAPGGSGRELIVIAAAPKSGSTYLANTLSSLTGLSYFRLCAAYSTNEHDLYLPALCLMQPYGCVSQLHVKGSFHNAALMRTFGIRPIILVRNIFDSVVSLQFDLREKAKMPASRTGQEGYSFLWQDQCINSLDDARLLDAIIDLALPWYVNFFVSWTRQCQQGAVEALWLTYEELFADKARHVKAILEFVGRKPAGDVAGEVLERKYATFRQGGSGAGETALSAAQRDRIRDRFAYYPDIDFGKFGL